MIVWVSNDTQIQDKLSCPKTVFDFNELERKAESRRPKNKNKHRPKNNSENYLPTIKILDLLIKSIFNEMDMGLIQLLKGNDNLRNQMVKQGDKGSVVKTLFTIFMISKCFYTD